jgi:hypothetical protein
MDINLTGIIKQALIDYDNMNQKYEEYIIQDKVDIDRNNLKITFKKNKTFNYEVLGLFDKNTNVWMWSWLVPDFKYNETLLTKKILNYGLKIEPFEYDKNKYDDMLYLKTQLVNTRFLLDNEYQLEIHLSIILYILKDNIKFLYYSEKDNMIVYYLII